MSFAGFHVSFAFAGGRGADEGSIQILNKPICAETLAASGTTTKAAPRANGSNPVATMISEVDAWVTFGPTPENPALPSSNRLLIFAGERVDLFVDPGDRVRWSVA